MLNINKITIAGHVGSIEARATADGKTVLNLSIATNKRWRNKQGDKQESTEWHRVVVFGKLAELVKNWIKTGTAIYVEGEQKTRKWQDKDGTDRWTTEIVVSGYSAVLQVLDSKEAPTPTASPAPAVDANDKSSDENIPEDDDIPF